MTAAYVVGDDSFHQLAVSHLKGPKPQFGLQIKSCGAEWSNATIGTIVSYGQAILKVSVKHLVESSRISKSMSNEGIWL